MSWLTAVSLSGIDKLIVGTFLFPILPLIPFAGHLWFPVVKKIQEKGGKIESPGYRLLWYLSVFLVNLVLAILLAAGICLAGYTLVDMLTSENTGIDGIGTALILVFAVWTAALTVFLIAMLPQLQMLMVAVLRMMKKTENFINHRLNCIFKDFLLIYKHQETERRSHHETELFFKQRISIFFRIKFLPWLYLLWKK